MNLKSLGTLQKHIVLQESLQTSLSLLPPESYVGLITYGRMVQVHELGCQGISRAYVFKGTKEITPKQIQVKSFPLFLPFCANMLIFLKDILGMTLGRPQGGAHTAATGAAPGAKGVAGQFQHQAGAAQHAPPVNKFLQPIKTCDMFINDLIDDIQPDPWPVPQGHRHVRATGTALSVAITLLEVLYAMPCIFRF